MTKSGKFAAKAAGALVIVSMFSASTFAEPRRQNESRRNDDRGSRSQSRVTVTGEGRIRNLQRENGGYRVQLDRGNDWYYVPQSVHSGGRGLDLRVGVNIRLGGYRDPRGYVYVSSADWLDDDYRQNDRRSVTGVVTSVDRRRGELLIRDRRSGRTVNVEMRNRGNRGNGRNRAVDFNDLRRGDRVTFEGQWTGRGVFEAYRVDSVDTRR